MKKPLFLLLIGIIIPLVIHAQEPLQDILFLGCKNAGAPALNSTYENALRSQLGTTPGIRLIGLLTSQRHRETIEFDRYPAIAIEYLDKLSGLIPDSTIIIWSQVTGTEITPLCKPLSRSVVHGSLSVKHFVLLFPGFVSSVALD